MSRIDEALRRAHRGSDRDLSSEPEPAVPFEFHAEPRRAASVIPMPPPRDEERPAPPAPPVPSTFDLGTGRVDGKLVISHEIEPDAVEEYRKLAAALHQVRANHAVKVVMVASAGAGEGKTLTAANLALTLAKSFQRRVLLVDTDLRRPMVHTIFGITNTQGLNDGLQAEADQQLHIVDVQPNLSLLTAGSPNPDPMGGLISERMRRILEDAAARFDWVVLDTPPVGLLPDAHLLAEMVDMVLMVVAAGATPLRDVRRAIDALGRDKIVGVVLNRAVSSAAVYDYGHLASTQDGGAAPVISQAP
jgi:capsular exopolysaccharide synthesis family protein